MDANKEENLLSYEMPTTVRDQRVNALEKVDSWLTGIVLFILAVALFVIFFT